MDVAISFDVKKGSIPYDTNERFGIQYECGYGIDSNSVTQMCPHSYTVWDSGCGVLN